MTFIRIIVLLLSSVCTSALPAANLKFGVIGDAGLWNSNSEGVQKSMIRSSVKNLILPGDNLYHSTYADVWGHWTQKGFSFDVVAIGNHTAGYPQEIAFFRMPAEFFSVVKGTSRFIVLNSDNKTNVPAQAAFLEAELTRATESSVFIVYHHPTYTLSRTHVWTEKSDFQLAVRAIFKRFRSKITALVVGHDHLALLAHFGDLPVILSGAVQEVRADTPRSGVQDGVQVTTNWFFDGSPYWAQLEIPATGRTVQVDFIRASDDQKSCSISIKTGERAIMSPNCMAHR
jgi:predicted phosphodiesterase